MLILLNFIFKIWSIIPNRLKFTGPYLGYQPLNIKIIRQFNLQKNHGWTKILTVQMENRLIFWNTVYKEYGNLQLILLRICLKMKLFLYLK